jgi:hypothetical protein
MSRCPFIGSEGEQGGQALEWNERRWCAIMAMKAAVSEGDHSGTDEGGGGECSDRYESGRGRGDSACASRRQQRRGRAVGGGRRRGGAHMSVRERERDGLGRADREAKAQKEWGRELAGRKPRPKRLDRNLC